MSDIDDLKDELERFAGEEKPERQKEFFALIRQAMLTGYTNGIDIARGVEGDTKDWSSYLREKIND